MPKTAPKKSRRRSDYVIWDRLAGVPIPNESGPRKPIYTDRWYVFNQDSGDIKAGQHVWVKGKLDSIGMFCETIIKNPDGSNKTKHVNVRNFQLRLHADLVPIGEEHYNYGVRTIGQRIEKIRDLARELGDTLAYYEPEEDSEHPDDDAADAEHAAEALAILADLPKPPTALARIKFAYRLTTPDGWDSLDTAKELGDDVRKILEVLEESGHGDDEWTQALEETMDWFNEFS